MTIHVGCPRCGEPVGVVEFRTKEEFKIPIEDRIRILQDGTSGCNHQEVQSTEKIVFFGMVKQTKGYYPETKTEFLHQEYIGPLNIFLLWLTIILNDNDGVSVNGEMTYWDHDIGFFGKGIDEFNELKAKAA